MSQTILSTIIHITPPIEELLYTTQIRCEVNGCQSVFKNSGNLQMHLKKHHKLSTDSIKDNTDKLFFCPQLDCVYYDGPLNERGFKSLKFLKQHFQKVHAEKKFACSKCGKAFGTQSMKESHEKNCGKEYICAECGWKYDTSEALLTHVKRKGHHAKRKLENKVAIPKLTPVAEKPKIIIPIPKDCQTQTELDTPNIVLPPKKRIKVEIAPEVSMFHEAPLCNIETQTELNLISGLSDPMLYSNMCTQTCDEFLSELGLADIQTQTNWPAMNDHDEPNRNDQFSSSGAHDELMVSTETQTSFTQCLLDSCNEENSLTGSITQHTQTCDTLLEGLFGGQDNDFIGSFQSTHTQT
ncbi:ATM interactor [Episyrphus balteatus]|uniref:ATM interactor n=1 Tax=Episyrphus balteatus TaxID=286459 RepID=UPI00248571F8|nr:ATM interactor [Episyrphus balteatus]